MLNGKTPIATSCATGSEERQFQTAMYNGVSTQRLSNDITTVKVMVENKIPIPICRLKDQTRCSQTKQNGNRMAKEETKSPKIPISSPTEKP